MQDQIHYSKEDLYLLVYHQSGGNTLYKTVNREESVITLGIKVEDHNMDKDTQEVKTSRKTARTAKSKS